MPKDLKKHTVTPEPSSGQNAQNSELTFSEMRYSGPIPPASELQAYADINPELVDRIVTMAEKEQASRHEILKRAQDSGIVERRIGQFLGFLIGITCISGGVYAVTSGHDFAGAAIGAGGVVGLVSVFVLGRRERHKKEDS